MLRHKNRKREFIAVYWITVVINCVALAWLLSPIGSDALRAITALTAE